MLGTAQVLTAANLNPRTWTPELTISPLLYSTSNFTLRYSFIWTLLKVNTLRKSIKCQRLPTAYSSWEQKLEEVSFLVKGRGKLSQEKWKAQEKIKLENREGRESSYYTNVHNFTIQLCPSPDIRSADLATKGHKPGHRKGVVCVSLSGLTGDLLPHQPVKRSGQTWQMLTLVRSRGKFLQTSFKHRC